MATLGYSRATFVRFSERERQEDWIQALEEAFEYFGGVPKEVLFDNAKAIMIERDAYGEGEHRWNPALLTAAKKYSFKPRACRPYRAKTKGKVERFNSYLKNSFVTPLGAIVKCGVWRSCSSLLMSLHFFHSIDEANIFHNIR